ncbi:hypothetical protein MRX96_032698 [Rhipicephalus microplus]
MENALAGANGKRVDGMRPSGNRVSDSLAFVIFEELVKAGTTVREDQDNRAAEPTWSRARPGRSSARNVANDPPDSLRESQPASHPHALVICIQAKVVSLSAGLAFTGAPTSGPLSTGAERQEPARLKCIACILSPLRMIHLRRGVGFGPLKTRRIFTLKKPRCPRLDAKIQMWHPLFFFLPGGMEIKRHNASGFTVPICLAPRTCATSGGNHLVKYV